MEAMHGTLDARCKEQTKRQWWTTGMLAGVGKGKVGSGEGLQVSFWVPREKGRAFAKVFFLFVYFFFYREVAAFDL